MRTQQVLVQLGSPICNCDVMLISHGKWDIRYETVVRFRARLMGIVVVREKALEHNASRNLRGLHLASPLDCGAYA
ncbi:hypothetical protein BLA17378_07538 [Burkholderia aenigmatica]|uniref:Uncharacterized protein n=1 Tax=Burkholderia aenigmatica TaxID=2015348 RepID=A0ABY6Y4C0_9BURK|nr:hypothetical protein BLA17378_07538 [Burkholderia aenigmatica]